MTEFAAVFPSITIICYLVGMYMKAINNEKIDKFIPSICGTIGAALGVLIYFTIPDFLPANNWAVAVEIGIISGLAATGINQIAKQLNNK